MNGARFRSKNPGVIKAVAALAMFSGCEETDPVNLPVATAPPVVTVIDVPPVLNAAELRQRLGTDARATFRRVGTEIVEAHLAGTGVQSIEPLRGLPLRVLDLGFCKDVDDISALAGMPLTKLILEGTSVADLTPLAGMSLELLYLQDTPVTDLSVIQKMPLKELNLKGVSISDITPFAEMPLSTLWLLETNVSDISPLNGMSLESLDVQDTAVSDLSALVHMTTLRRLNIAGTRVSDVGPVTGLKLERIFLSPGQIIEGMDELREIPSLGRIGTSHEHNFAAADFWERYDQRIWESKQEPADQTSTQEVTEHRIPASPPQTTPEADNSPESGNILSSSRSELPTATPPKNGDEDTPLR